MDESESSPELLLFLASTAHDMKNSVCVLSGTLEALLSKRAGQDDEAYAKMARMLYETKRLNDNLIQLLGLYKQVGKPGYPFDIRSQRIGDLVDLVRAHSGVLLDSSNITFEADVEPDLIWHYDEDLIIGVLGHAIHNAIRYTNNKVRLAITSVDGFLEIRVEDDGMGYPPPLLEAGACAMSGAATGVNFATNSTGLGLYFASEVVNMHTNRERRGSLWLENGGAYGGGCFVVRLP